MTMNLAKIFSLENDKLKAALRSEEYDKVKELILLANANDLGGETIQQAKILEGNLRNTGIDLKYLIGNSTDGAANMQVTYNRFSSHLSLVVPEQIHIWC